jgi:hypothetical protein
VAIPELIAPDLAAHLVTYARPGNDGVVVHFHDLRHSGNQLAADEGAGLRELMEHMGHDSARAALIYLHTSAERQRAIADQVGKNAKAALGKHERSGTRMARKANARRGDIMTRRTGHCEMSTDLEFR